MVPAWQRGVETGEVTAPYRQKLILTALGGSPATPEGGLEAEVVEMASLERPGREGRRRLSRTGSSSSTRGWSGAPRWRATDTRWTCARRALSRAARLGAAGVLIRSIGTDRNRLPHTGAVDYVAEVPKIPAAALAIPDAEMLERLLQAGKAGARPLHADLRRPAGCGVGERDRRDPRQQQAGRDRAPRRAPRLVGPRHRGDRRRGRLRDRDRGGAADRTASETSAANDPRLSSTPTRRTARRGARRISRRTRRSSTSTRPRSSRTAGRTARPASPGRPGPSAEPFAREVARDPGAARRRRRSPPGGGGADTGTLKIAGVPMLIAAAGHVELLRLPPHGQRHVRQDRPGGPRQERRGGGGIRVLRGFDAGVAGEDSAGQARGADASRQAGDEDAVMSIALRRCLDSGFCLPAAPAPHPVPLPRGERERFAKLALACIDREYPNKPEHVLDSAADAKPPRDFHPAFFGCYDWHSSVHGHWMLVRLLKTFPDLPSQQGDSRAALAPHFTAEAMATEARYLDIKSNRSFERTYGWAWTLRLMSELADLGRPGREGLAREHRAAREDDRRQVEGLPAQAHEPDPHGRASQHGVRPRRGARLREGGG